MGQVMRGLEDRPAGERHPLEPGHASYDSFRSQLLRQAAGRMARDTGDHVLNPDLGPYARWTGAPRDAAVLIPVVIHEAEPTVILTLRTPHLSSHAGQIAFPGGKIDGTDGGPWQAALREANEEIGLDPRSVEKVAELAPYLTGSGYKVTPVVAGIRPGFSLQPNPGEVADIFEVPLSFLMNPANHLKQSRDWEGKPRYFYAMPYGERYIWGVTAGIIRSLYETVYG